MIGDEMGGGQERQHGGVKSGKRRTYKVAKTTAPKEHSRVEAIAVRGKQRPSFLAGPSGWTGSRRTLTQGSCYQRRKSKSPPRHSWAVWLTAHARPRQCLVLRTLYTWLTIHTHFDCRHPAPNASNCNLSWVLGSNKRIHQPFQTCPLLASWYFLF